MKKPIKFAIIGLIVLASAAGTVAYIMMPVPVRMTQVMAQVAELTFTEQGIVTAENTILVFPATQGELSGLYVREGQQVEAGDSLVSVDDTALRLRLDQVQSGIRSLEAQLANVDVEDAAMRQNLTSTRNSLQGELQRINAQASETHRAIISAQEAIDEQVRIQGVLIDQHQSELERVQENFQRVNILHQSGVATLSEFESANAAVIAAETALEAARGQMAVIAAGAQEDSAEVFAGMRTSINAQIDGINQQLAQDTTTAVKAHFEAMIAVEQVNAAQIEREIANSVVRAPVSGIVTTLHAQGTNFISAASPVAEITVPGSLTVNVYVSTQDTGSIRVGDTVGLTLRQRLEDIEFTGRVIEIDSTAVVRLTALGVEERKVNVQVQPEAFLYPAVNIGIGHALDVTFYVFREEGQIVVPRTAVFRENGQDMVWAVRGGRSTAGGRSTVGGRYAAGDEGIVQATPVELGMELRTDVIIINGLNEGDFVINDANNADISDGTRVINER